MKGTGHALSGAVMWLTGWSFTTLAGLAQPRPDVLVFGTFICAGAALVNDLDHPESRLAQIGGPATRALATAVGWVGSRIHAATKLDADRPDEDGHRTITHTFLFAALAGTLVAGFAGLAGELGAWLARTTGWPATARLGQLLPAGIMFAFTKVGYVAVRSAFAGRQRRIAIWPGRKRRWRKSTVLATAAGVYAYVMLPASVWWLGLAVGVGLATHCLGDALTIGGCPLLWPLPVPGRSRRYDRSRKTWSQVWVWRTWYLVGTPRWMRFPVGQSVEKHVTRGIIVLGVLALAGLVYAAGLPPTTT